ncbi:MAG TPA: hypothetical protein VMV10_16085 [Pirellulales bacterium]|nr:hypothetical protein [Pirellulales bacterium]
MATELSRIAQLEQFSPETLAKVIRLTRQLFPGEVSTELLQDPESPSETFVVLNVEAPADDERLIDRQCEWHEQVSGVAGCEAPSYRISIDPKQ